MLHVYYCSCHTNNIVKDQEYLDCLIVNATSSHVIEADVHREWVHEYIYSNNESLLPSFLIMAHEDM